MQRLSIITLCVAALVGARPDAGLAQSAPADLSGAWTIVSVERAPWSKNEPIHRAWVGSTVAFENGRMAGPNVFACGNAKYERVQSEPRGLFQGVLPEASADRDARALGIPNPATTLSVTCDTGIFDFHRAGADLVIGFDNQILRMKRAGK